MADTLSRALRGLRRDGARAQRDPGLMLSIGFEGAASSARTRDNDHLEEDDPSRPEEASNEVREGSPAEREHNYAHGRAERGMDKPGEECPMCGGEHAESVHLEDDDE
jgi:hypothetical protein